MFNINSNENIILTSQIQIVTIEVTEVINEKFINEFILTTLKENNILITDNTYISYKFISQTKVYEIYVLNTQLPNFIIEPSILHQFYQDEDTNDSIDLFILKDFFALFKNKKLYIFKSYNESSEDDIIAYISQTYKINIDNIYNINKNQFNKLKILYLKKKIQNNNFIQLKRDNSSLYFVVYTIILSIIFSILLYNLFSNSSISKYAQLNKLEYKYNQLKKKKYTVTKSQKIMPKVIELFKYIKLQNLKTNKIHYENDKLQLTLFHKDKNKLLNFLTIYNKQIKIRKIDFLPNEKLYNMVIEIAF